MSHRELTEWLAWYRLELRSDDRADARTAWAVLYQMMAATRGRARNMKWSDFLPPFRPPPPGASEDPLTKKAKSIFGKFRGARRRRGSGDN